ncbi:MAG: hypothetical protein ACOX6Q_00480 [Candidatus Dojkabacteria bacterium]|jgi:membrane-associated phospholipid phosphatase
MNTKKFARIISEIFNGFTLMVLSVAIPLFVSDISNCKKFTYITIYTLIPLLSYFAVKKFAKISDHDFTDRRERPPFFVTLTVLFGIMHLLLKREGIQMLTDTSLALFASTTALTLVTFFWKMSGHMTYSTLFFTSMLYTFKNPLLLLLYIFTPIIGWARIKLSKHTLAQVIAGTFVTLTISVLIFFVF